ncbi:proteasome-activating nucleotidase [Methanogenium sp. MK-MG]|uniref:proteasome-activating nucleotidase n=1 Tax=Methanogenium sp. MK-MG TaxID=2599926 RepID=UPI00352B9C35
MDILHKCGENKDKYDMDETIISNTNTERNPTSLTEQEYEEIIDDLQETVEIQTKELSSAKKENEQLKKENNQLKRTPLFVASVIDILDSGEVYLRQQGNNQEYITGITDDLRTELKPGMKVAVNNALSIVRIVANSVDSRVRVMELIESPDTTFEKIGGLREEIEEVREAVEYPLTKPEIFRRIGVEPPKGILLYGPPGTGKTLIAKAVAHQANATFIRMSGSELVHKFIGEGAQMVRELFTMARERAPSIVFIDEIDAIGTMRMHDGTSGSAEVQRTLMQLLAEMDGFDNRGDVRIMGATNRVDMLDPALLRPGRFDRVVMVPLPDTAARHQILKIHSAKMQLVGVPLDKLAAEAENTTGAELEAICREAGMMAVRRDADAVTWSDFEEAMRKVRDKTQKPDIMFL